VRPTTEQGSEPLPTGRDAAVRDRAVVGLDRELTLAFVQIQAHARHRSGSGARNISVLAACDSVYLASALMPPHFRNNSAAVNVKAPTAADMEKFVGRSRNALNERVISAGR